MSLVRKASYFFLSCVFAFALAYFIPEQVDRKEFSQAVITYSRNPIAENAAVLELERRKNERIHLQDSAIIGSAFVLAADAILSARRLIKDRSHKPDVSHGN